MSDVNIKKLGELCNFVRGPFGGSLKKDSFTEQGFAVYEQQHAIYDQFQDIRYFIDEDKFEQMKRFELKPGDLIMSCSGTMGRVAIVPHGIKPGIINQALLKLTPKDILDVEFLKYWMQSPSFTGQLQKHTVGAAIKNVASVKILKTIELPAPPLPEQKRVVEILDEAFDAIDQAKANIEKNIQNAKELFQSKLNEIFSQKGEGWEMKKLGEMSKIMYGYTSKVDAKGNIQYLRITDIQNGNVDWDEVPYVNVSVDERPKYELIPGDIVFARTGATTGKSYLLQSPQNALFASYLIRVQCDSSILDPSFLYLFFHSGIYWKIVDAGISGSAQGGFNATKLGDMTIHYPTAKSEQLKYVELIESIRNPIEEQISLYNIRLSNLEELKKSILQKAFSGELTAVEQD